MKMRNKLCALSGMIIINKDFLEDFGGSYE